MQCLHDDLIEDIAAHTMQKIMDHARKKSQLEEFESIRQPVCALCELWKLKWKHTQEVDLRVCQTSQDLTVSINVYVAGCEEALMSSDVVNG